MAFCLFGSDGANTQIRQWRSRNANPMDAVVFCCLCVEVSACVWLDVQPSPWTPCQCRGPICFSLQYICDPCRTPLLSSSHFLFSSATVAPLALPPLSTYCPSSNNLIAIIALITNNPKVHYVQLDLAPREQQRTRSPGRVGSSSAWSFLALYHDSCLVGCCLRYYRHRLVSLSLRAYFCPAIQSMAFRDVGLVDHTDASMTMNDPSNHPTMIATVYDMVRRHSSSRNSAFPSTSFIGYKYR